MSEVQVSGHAQNNLYRSGYVQSLPGLDSSHIGGSVRGYQGLPAPLAIPATARPDSGEVVLLCIASARVNFRFCR